MQVLSELIAGIRGAENGTANIYERATSTLATVYADYDGSVALPQPLTLDSYGGTEVYVNEEVDVRVQDVDGVTMRQFSPMGVSNSIEYVGPAFTGRRYSDAFSGLSQPVTLQAILDLWEANNGAPDWKVELPGGTEVTVQQAVAGVAGLFFNVMDPTYGAVGDGVADDTVAVQAALTAAGIDGGIVVFPAGTYLVTSVLTVPVKVSMWGMGSDVSVVKIDHATADLFEYGAGSSISAQEIRGLGLSVTGANTGKLLSLTVAGGRVVHVSGCMIGDEAGLHTGDPVSHLLGSLLISDSIINIKTSGGINANAVARLDLRNCYIVQNGTAAYNGALVTMKFGTVIGCRLSFGATSGSHVGILVDGSGSTALVQIVGNYFSANGGTAGGIQGSNINFAAASIVAGENTFASNVIKFAGLGIQANNPQTQLVDREASIRNVTDDTGTVALQGDQYGVVVLTRTAAGGATLLTSSVGPPGSFLTVIVYNNSGGALGGDFTMSTGFRSAMVITKPANGNISVAHFRTAYAAGTGAWVPLSAPKTDF